eukprot:7529578-Pyramimonas_sp.AAC.1
MRWPGTPARETAVRRASWQRCSAQEKPIGSTTKQACTLVASGSPAMPRASRCRLSIGGSLK